ncbi:iron ABC transporter permease [Polaromonas sp. CF318]|uniref:ABC transporter permease n=1 Tax=Polaromonas sp. CF318 TaxID=1144318 RepID=UPI00031F55A3|nr:iron ABC transporter permease [Polaromonas sp. CF318]
MTAAPLRTQADPLSWLLAGLAIAAGVLLMPWTQSSAYVAGGCALAAVASVLATRAGAFKSDAAISGVVCILSLLLAIFVIYPIGRMLLAAFVDERGNWLIQTAAARFFSADIWGAGCITGSVRCGVAINSIALATLAGVGSTLFGFALALLAERGGRRLRGSLRVLSILPVVTPPFVIGLAIIILFGRTGIVTQLMSDWFGIARSRWIYGLPGVLLAQVVCFTPLAFLLISGALRLVSPTLEEAGQVLRGSPWHVFRTVTWPLVRPAIANAFLLGFVESLADFANPLVLSGNFEVLSTKIFFAIAGAQHDASRAAILAVTLLLLTVGVFALQQRWIGKASYTSVSGKGDSGLPATLPTGVKWGALALVLPWAALTVLSYGIILIGGVVKDIGRFDLTPSLQHFETGFGLSWGAGGLVFSGSAWNSLFTTLGVAAVAAPLTTALGLLGGYVVSRHAFKGRRAFEFLTMVNFAVPGTVIGVAYIVAFNVPPLEFTGTFAIIVLCLVFRNMPVGVRATVSALSQLDRSLDEASATLRASTSRTFARVILPLLRPAIIASLVFSFTHAITAVSAVIFLATAQHNLSTVYIAGRVEVGEYALAIAYSSVLIVIMLACVLLIQRFIGNAELGRRAVSTA